MSHSMHSIKIFNIIFLNFWCCLNIIFEYNYVFWVIDNFYICFADSFAYSNATLQIFKKKKSPA